MDIGRRYARRSAAAAALAGLAAVVLPAADAAAALAGKAPTAKEKAEAAKKAAAAKAAAAKKAADAKKAATTTVATVTGPSDAAKKAAADLGYIIGPPLDKLPDSDPNVKLPQADKIVVGDSFNLETWGPVTVTIAVSGGKIVAVSSDLPTERPRSRYLNERVGPYLNSEAVKLQSAKYELITGATRTCEGYKLSLQSAIDKAGLGS